MRYIVLLLILLIKTQSISPGIHKQEHKVTSQCCISKGGKVCGTIIQDCCKSECSVGFLSSQWCKNHETISPICPTCMSICKGKGGIPCQVSVDSGIVSCCSIQNCVKSKNKVDTSGILKKTLGYIVTGAISAMASGSHQHQLADEIIQKVVGPNNYCKEGTQINLQDCNKDSFFQLLETRALS